MDEKEDKFNTEIGEDTTKYGEFISSFFGWISMDEQKKRAEDLEKITKSKKDQK